MDSVNTSTHTKEFSEDVEKPVMVEIDRVWNIQSCDITQCGWTESTGLVVKGAVGCGNTNSSPTIPETLCLCVLFWRFSKVLVLGCNLPLVGEGNDPCGSINDLCTLVPGLIFKGTTGCVVESLVLNSHLPSFSLPDGI